MLIFHISTRADWQAATRTGSYTTSTLGRTLAEEGFIHASRREQVPGVFQSFYRNCREPLVLLTIDTDRLDVPWREDRVGEETFPHIYGPLSPQAVTRVQELDRRGSTGSFTGSFIAEMAWRIGVAMLAMLCSALGALAGAVLDSRLGEADGWGRFIGAVSGLVLGALLGWVALKRRDRAR